MSDIMIDLRHRVLRFAELRRRYAANMPLTDAEVLELANGIGAAEMLTIIEQIRAERRSAAPSNHAKLRKAARERQAPADLSEFLATQNDPPQ